MLKQLKKVSRRHQLPMWLALPYELFVRLYRKRVWRRWLRRFFPERNPAGWIFLVGCYNAGTTVVKNAIAAHPDVVAAPVEGDVLTSHLPRFEDGGWPRAMYGNAYLIQSHRQRDMLNGDAIRTDWSPWLRNGQFFIEKSISNSTRIDLLRRAFPGCKFVCVVRDPEAVAKGIIKRSRPSSRAAEFLGQQTYPESFLRRQWAFLYDLILRDARDEDTFFCSYENFIAASDQETQALYQFLGLPEVEVTFRSGKLIVANSEISIRPLADEHVKVVDIMADLKLRVQQIRSENGDGLHGG